MKKRGRPRKIDVDAPAPMEPRYIIKNPETGEYFTASNTWSKLLGNAKIYRNKVKGAIEI